MIAENNRNMQNVKQLVYSKNFCKQLIANVSIYSKEVFLAVEVRVMLERRAWYLMGGPPLGLWDRNDFPFFSSANQRTKKNSRPCVLFILYKTVDIFNHYRTIWSWELRERPSK